MIPLFEEYEDSFNDYPSSAVTAAKKAIKWKEEYGDKVKGGTQVGWIRANQLSNKDNLSLDTIKRIKAFYDRMHENFELSEEHKDEPWKDAGYISGLIWGFDGKSKGDFYKWLEDKLK